MHVYVAISVRVQNTSLSRVPWKSLAKLRCVCKLWNSLILEERLNKKNLSFHMHIYSGEHRFILLDTGPKISAVGIEEQQNNVDDPPSLISDHARQSYDFYKERFQPTDDLPFSYDEMNPIALEIYKGDRLSVLEQCHKTRKICIWVKHWLMLTSWTKLVVVDIPEFPLIYPRLTLLSTNYYFDKNNRLVITCNDTDMKGLSIIQVIKANEGECRFPFLCSYVPSVVRIPGFRSKTQVGFAGEN
ncbi:hypothetical protein HID58_093285, partial [Brassica napus]